MRWTQEKISIALKLFEDGNSKEQVASVLECSPRAVALKLTKTGHSLREFPFYKRTEDVTCASCGNSFVGNISESRKFCSHSCSAKHNNKGTRRHGVEPGTCIQCGKKKRRASEAFCSCKCHKQHQYEENTRAWLAGEKPGHNGSYMQITNYVNRWLREQNGRVCAICGLSEWRGQPIPLEVDHIDGNPSRTVPDNLRLVCPNCAALLPTYKSKNRGNGRFTRLERYKQGKSF